MLIYAKRFLNGELLTQDELAEKIRETPGLLERIAEKVGDPVEFMQERAKEEGESVENIAALAAFNQVTMEYCEECYVRPPWEDDPDPYEFFAKYWLEYTPRIKGE